MPKRLLIITQHFWPENFRINDMVDGFLADGIVVDIVCGLPNYPHGEWFSGYDATGPLLEDYHGANLYRCREVRRKGNTSLRIFLNYISYPITAALTLRKLPGGPGSYDAVLCYNTSPVLMSWPAILAARKFKAPLTNYVLDLWPENLYSVLNIQNKALRKLASAVSDWHYRHADRLIAMNEGLKERLLARVGTKNARGCAEAEKRYAVIAQYCEDFYDCQRGSAAGSANPSSSTTPTTSATATTHPTSPEHTTTSPASSTTATADNLHETGSTVATAAAPLLIQFAGNFSPAQGLSTVLEAMAMVKETTTPPICLRLVGDGMSADALKAQAARLALGDWVQFYGSVAPTDMPPLAAQADALLVSLSDSADLGLTVPAKFASCMAAGKPLLVSMGGEGARIAAESSSALVSDAADAAALAQNIQTLAALPEAQREAMGKAAHAYYKAHFDRTTLLQQIEDFIF